MGFFLKILPSIPSRTGKNFRCVLCLKSKNNFELLSHIFPKKFQGPRNDDEVTGRGLKIVCGNLNNS